MRVMFNDKKKCPKGSKNTEMRTHLIRNCLRHLVSSVVKSYTYGINSGKFVVT